MAKIENWVHEISIILLFKKMGCTALKSFLGIRGIKYTEEEIHTKDMYLRQIIDTKLILSIFDHIAGMKHEISKKILSAC